MISKSTIIYFNNKLEEEEKRYNGELEKLRQEHLKRIEEIKREKMIRLKRETNVSSLKKQAYQSYVMGYSKMKKEELIEKVDNRINKEKLLGLPEDLLNKIGDEFLEIRGRNNMRTICKTMKKRVKYIKPELIRNIKMLEKCVNDLGENNINKTVKRINEYYKRKPATESNKSMNVKIIKRFLKLNGDINTKDGRKKAVLGMYDFLVCRVYFLKSEVVFMDTVLNKVRELKRTEPDMREKLEKYERIIESIKDE